MLRICLIAGTLLAALYAVMSFFFPPSGTQVLIAGADISAGTPITGQVVVSTNAPADLVPDDAIKSVGSLPPVWPGPSIKKGTILSESLTAGSIHGRSVPTGFHRLSVTLPKNAMPELESGDLVDLWAMPYACDEHTCEASLISTEVLIGSISVEESPTWGSASTVRTELILRDTDTTKVLGHSGAGTLSLVLRHRGDNPPSS